MSYRNDLDALAARHAALETEVAAKTRELDQAARLLDEAKARSRLPVLDNIRVASPCTAAWSAMSGDERVRHCGACQKNVYNLSDLTREEAEALIIAKEGKLCVRYFQRQDGTILLKDCTIGARHKRRRRLVAVGAAAMLAGGAAIYAKLTGDVERADTHHAIAGEPMFVEPEPEEVEEVEEVEEFKGQLVEPAPKREVLGGVSLEEHHQLHPPEPRK